MNLEDLLKELQALIDKYSADDAEPTDEDLSLIHISEPTRH